MYNVRMSRRYTVAAARSRIADLLDEVERGETVVIERRGLRFEIVARGERKRPRRRAVMIEYIDPAILGADWTWEWKPGQLRFKTRQRT